MIEVEVKLPVADMDGIKAKLLKMGFTESCFIQERIHILTMHVGI